MLSQRHSGYGSVIVVIVLLPLLFAVAATPDGRGPPISFQDVRSSVLVARIEDDAITPVTSGYLQRALREAIESGAVCLIIELDTPGGLLESTRTIVKDLLASRVPIVVYVAPSGARAASAGVFITLASHVAAMAPATHIGAAHPVQMGGAPGQPPDQEPASDSPTPSTMDEKILNDTVAWVRSIAVLRGRNEEWAEKSVTESVSIPSTEALELNVIDVLADDISDLLRQIDGWEVELESGTVILETVDVEVVRIEMWWGEMLLSVISNPNIAFLLLMLGFYGLLFEFYSPGWGISGTLGAICIILAFFGLAVLPINYAGLALIFLGIGLFVAEAFFTSFGILTVGGAVCLILGGIMLVDTPVPIMRISWSVVVPVAIASAAIAFFLVSRVVKTHRTRVQTGEEGLLEEIGVVFEPFKEKEGQYAGVVQIHGEIWQAVCTRPLRSGDEVNILSRTNLTLNVRKSTGLEKSKLSSDA